MTHRVLSRNAASSRAIPVKKIIDDILADTAMPLHWGKNQKGMQADQECEELVVWSSEPDRDGYGSREDAWTKARDNAIEIARAFDASGYHKQVVNRLLEPFAHITVLVSATEWDNFLELRDHKDAEPHIQMLARQIRKCLEDETTIQTLNPGEWHMPFVARADWKSLEPLPQEAKDMAVLGSDVIGFYPKVRNVDDMIKLSVARCASTSYKTVDGFDMTLERAIEIHDKLVGSRPMHASPCEHVAQADKFQKEILRNGRTQGWWHLGEHGNFIGFRQYRHML